MDDLAWKGIRDEGSIPSASTNGFLVVVSKQKRGDKMITGTCLTRDEIAKRRLDLKANKAVAKKAKKDAVELEWDLIPQTIAREIAEIGYCVLYHQERAGKQVVHIALPEELEIARRDNEPE